MHMATRRVRNIDRLGQDIGEVSFVVPQAVLDELGRLADHSEAKRADAEQTIEFAGRFGIAPIYGSRGNVDDAILSHAAEHGSIVATMDRELKSRLKKRGCTVMSFSNDSIVLEP